MKSFKEFLQEADISFSESDVKKAISEVKKLAWVKRWKNFFENLLYQPILMPDSSKLNKEGIEIVRERIASVYGQSLSRKSLIGTIEIEPIIASRLSDNDVQSIWQNIRNVLGEIN